jgi:hypothetical protein
VLSLGIGVLPLYGVATAVVWFVRTSLCAILVLRFLHYLFSLKSWFMVGLFWMKSI